MLDELTKLTRPNEKIKIEYPNEESKEYERFLLIKKKVNEINQDITKILDDATDDIGLNNGEIIIYKYYLIDVFNEYIKFYENLNIED